MAKSRKATIAKRKAKTKPNRTVQWIRVGGRLMRRGFGLLNLPAELRNMVYHYCLIHNRNNGQVANMLLLRVSRQIFDETRWIVTDKQICSIKATALILSTGQFLGLSVDGDVRALCVGRPGILGFVRYRPDLCPLWLWQRTSISLVLDLSHSAPLPVSGHRALHHFLYAFVGLLQSHPLHRKKNLFIEVRSATPSYKFLEKRMLYPLSKLCPDRWRIFIRGSAVPGIEAEVKRVGDLRLEQVRYRTFDFITNINNEIEGIHRKNRQYFPPPQILQMFDVVSCPAYDYFIGVSIRLYRDCLKQALNERWTNAQFQQAVQQRTFLHRVIALQRYGNIW